MDRVYTKKPELLLPASNLEVLRTAVYYGADAVYIGGNAYGLRAGARNFSPEDMRAGIDFAHEHGVRVYVTVNIFAHNEDMEGIAAYLRELEQMRPDALIISDPGVYELACEHAPSIERHISTQANNVNYGTFLFWHKLGAGRVVCGRELSLAEIAAIREKIPEDMEIEVFVHGAMCMSYSGRCLMSNYLTGRDANRGACTHPCRWFYDAVDPASGEKIFAVEEKSRPGEVMEVVEDERGTSIFHSKDLCMIDHVPDLISAGIDSFKIEGRMKNALYVATVCRAYRDAIDTLLSRQSSGDAKGNYADHAADNMYMLTDSGIAGYQAKLDWYSEQVRSCTYRDFCTGFFYGQPDENSQVYEGEAYHEGRTYLGIVGEPCMSAGSAKTAVAEASADIGSTVFRLEQKNKFSVGDEIEIMGFDGRDRRAAVLSISDIEGHPQPSAPHAGQQLIVTLSEPTRPGEILRTSAE